MKKTLISSLILATLVLPFGVSAQEVSSTATVADVDALKSTLITLLTQLIAQLQEQIQTILATQASTTQAVIAVQNQLTTVAQTPAPVLGSAPSVPSPTVSLGTPVCEEIVWSNGFHSGVYNFRIPLSVSGIDWTSAKGYYQGIGIANGPVQNIETINALPNDPRLTIGEANIPSSGTHTITVKLFGPSGNIVFSSDKDVSFPACTPTLTN